MSLETIEIGLFSTIISLLIFILYKLLKPQQQFDLSPIVKESGKFIKLATSITDSQTQISQSHNSVIQSANEMNTEYKDMKETLDALNTTLGETRADNQNIQQFGRDLKDVLAKPNIRGNIGEKLLEEMCSEYLPDHVWRRQAVTNPEAKTDRGGVDVLISYNDIDLPVDSKFPRDAWKRYITLAETSMSEMSLVERENHHDSIKNEYEAFITSVKNKVKECKTHIHPPKTTEFALMFVPSEAMYYSLVSEKNVMRDQNVIETKKGKISVMDWMLVQQVIPVSPSMFFSYLAIIQLGLSNLAIVENLEELRSKVNLFKTKRGTFAERHEEVGANLESALQSWKDQGKRFQELVKKADEVIGALDNVEKRDKTTEED